MQKFTDEKKKLTDSYSALQTEYADYKASKMTDDEKKEEASKKMEQNYKDLCLKYNRKAAEKIFAASGFQEEEYSEILEGIVGEDEETTIKTAQSICNVMTAKKKDIEKDIKTKVAQGTPKPEAGDGETVPDKKEDLEKKLSEATKKGDYVKMATYTRMLQEIKE